MKKKKTVIYRKPRNKAFRLSSLLSEGPLRSPHVRETQRESDNVKNRAEKKREKERARKNTKKDH